MMGWVRRLRVRRVMRTPWVSINVSRYCFKAFFFFFQCNLCGPQIRFFCVHLYIGMPWEDRCVVHNHNYHICCTEQLRRYLVSTFAYVLLMRSYQGMGHLLNML